MGDENDNPTEDHNIGHAEVGEVIFNWPGRTVTNISEAEVFWDMGPEDQDYLLRFPHGRTPPLPRQGDTSENLTGSAQLDAVDQGPRGLGRRGSAPPQPPPEG